MWANGHIRRAEHGFEPTREAAMAAFAKGWRREGVDRPAGGSIQNESWSHCF